MTPPRVKKASAPDQVKSEEVPMEIQTKALVQEALEIQEKIQPELDRLDEIKEDLRVLAGVGRHGDHLTISASTRLDPVALKAAYPATTHPFLYTLALDLEAVKAKLPPETVDTFKKPYGKDRVIIK